MVEDLPRKDPHAPLGGVGAALCELGEAQALGALGGGGVGRYLGEGAENIFLLAGSGGGGRGFCAHSVEKRPLQKIAEVAGAHRELFFIASFFF